MQWLLAIQRNDMKQSIRMQNLEPGIAKQLLVNKFSTLPTGGDFLNGHVLYLYVITCEHSRARTEQELLSHLPTTAQQGSAYFLRLSVQIKKLVTQTLGKLKKLSDTKEFQRFDLFFMRNLSCNKSYQGVQLRLSIQQMQGVHTALKIQKRNKQPPTLYL